MEKIIDENELSILKIVGKHPEIHQRALLRIIDDKSLMAKKTAEKNIKNLVQEKRIFAYKYGKEIQYVLAAGELSEKDLKKKVSITVKKFKTELDNIEKDFDKFDFFYKRNFPDYLSKTFYRMVEEKSWLLRYAKMNKLTDMAFAEELFHEICDLSKKLPENDKLIQEKIEQSRKIATDIDKMNRKCVELLLKRNPMSSSKKRETLSQKIKQLEVDTKNKYISLKTIRDDFKNYR